MDGCYSFSFSLYAKRMNLSINYTTGSLGTLAELDWGGIEANELKSSPSVARRLHSPATRTSLLYSPTRRSLCKVRTSLNVRLRLLHVPAQLPRLAARCAHLSSPTHTALPPAISPYADCSPHAQCRVRRWWIPAVLSRIRNCSAREMKNRQIGGEWHASTRCNAGVDLNSVLPLDRKCPPYG